MSDVIPYKNLPLQPGRRKFSKEPKEIQLNLGTPNRIIFDDGTDGEATCLGCHDTPCMQINSDSLRVNVELEAFTGNPSQKICPTNALDWNVDTNSIEIDPGSCIGCGLCAVFCPYGAINLADNGLAEVANRDLDHITQEEGIDDTGHLSIKKIGVIAPAQTHFLMSLPDIVTTLHAAQTTHLVRNTLIALGLSASMRRTGDTNVRLDGVCKFETGELGVIELEASNAVLESPRALLEDIAVLHNRYAVPLEEIIPISIITTLPKVRSEYYRVIDDINKVLGIKLHTITLGALTTMSWNFVRISETFGDLFMTQAQKTDLLPSLQALIPDVEEAEPHPGAYRPPT